MAGRRLAVIEDALRERGADIAAVVCVIDRQTRGAENLAAQGLELRSALTMSQLRQAAAAESQHSS